MENALTVIHSQTRVRRGLGPRSLRRLCNYLLEHVSLRRRGWISTLSLSSSKHMFSASSPLLRHKVIIVVLLLPVFIELFLHRCFMRAHSTPGSPTPIGLNFKFIHKVEGRGIVLWSRASSLRCPGCPRRALSVNLALSFLEGNQFFQELDAFSQSIASVSQYRRYRR